MPSSLVGSATADIAITASIITIASKIAMILRVFFMFFSPFQVIAVIRERIILQPAVRSET